MALGGLLVLAALVIGVVVGRRGGDEDGASANVAALGFPTVSPPSLLSFDPPSHAPSRATLVPSAASPTSHSPTFSRTLTPVSAAVVSTASPAVLLIDSALQVPSQAPSALRRPQAPINPPTSTPIPIITSYSTSFEILETRPHDSTSFTQGLEIRDGWMYESAGGYGASRLFRTSMAGSLLVDSTVSLPTTYFAEGLTYANGRWLQLTWQEGVVLVYDETLTLLQLRALVTSTGEGWGICFHAERNVLYVSDGSANLHVWDGETLEEISRVEVAMRSIDGSRVPVLELNELEWDPTTGTVLANVWKQDIIVRIDPSTGVVMHVYDMASLERSAGSDVLNGIARTDEQGVFWVTGKWWPTLYRVRLIDS